MIIIFLSDILSKNESIVPGWFPEGEGGQTKWVKEIKRYKFPATK